MSPRRKVIRIVLGATGIVAVLLLGLAFLAPRLRQRRCDKNPDPGAAGEADGGPALLRSGRDRLFPPPQAGAPGGVPLRPVAGGRDGEASRGGHFAARPVAESGPDRVPPGGGPGFPGADAGEGERGGASLPRRDRGKGLPPPFRDGLARAGRGLRDPGWPADPFRREPSPPVAAGHPGSRLASAGPPAVPPVLRLLVLGVSGHRRQPSLRGAPGGGPGRGQRSPTPPDPRAAGPRESRLPGRPLPVGTGPDRIGRVCGR